MKPVSFSKEKLASKFIGRWRDGTPLELSPDRMDLSIVQDSNRSTNFQYAKDDLAGIKCPLGAHIRRVNPRDAFGFEGRLIHRRRISRRSLPYGPPAPPENTSEGQDTEALDVIDRGIPFMAPNASFSRQFEFVQQQWISCGNDARLGNEKDLLMAHHEPGERYGIQGTARLRTRHSSAPLCPTSSSSAAEIISSYPALPRSACSP
jgi:hypothetical protein